MHDERISSPESSPIFNEAAGAAESKQNCTRAKHASGAHTGQNGLQYNILNVMWYPFDQPQLVF